MKLLAPASQEAAVGRVLDEGVLEHIGGFRRLAVGVDQIRRGQLRERGIERARRHRRDRGKQTIREFAPDGGADLRDLLDRREPVETRHQRVVQGHRNRGNGDRLKHVILARVVEHPGFEDRLGHFLDKQGNPVGLADDDLRNLGGKALAVRQAGEHRADLILAQPLEPQHRHMGSVQPRREEIRPEGDQCEERNRLHASTVRLTSSSVVGSIQCASSRMNSTGLRGV